jgi:hypothetical protein
MLGRMEPKVLRRLFAILLVLAGLQLVVHANFLPALVADRFDATGTPRGWLERESFVMRRAVFLAAMPVLFMVLPAQVLRHWPQRLLARGRAYWLAPERREQTIAALGRMMLWLGLASVALAVIVTQLIFEANLRTPPQLEVDALWWALAAYVAFLIVWTWRLWRRFPRSPAGA